MAKFIKESDICKGSGSGINPSGITGNGPNSTATAKGVRAGRGIWREDLRTTHYKIKQLKALLNIAKNEYGRNDVPFDLVKDGIYGSKTAEAVYFVQGMPWFGLEPDGIAGANTLAALKSRLKTAIN